MAIAPILGHSRIPNQLKIGFAALLAIVISPILPAMPDIPLWSWAAFGIIVEQNAHLALPLALSCKSR